MFNLLDSSVMGQKTHRSGWPYVVRHLRRHSDPNASLILDDYIERTFLFEDHKQFRIEHNRPWVAICHHPHDMPDWYSHERLQDLEKEPRWVRSFDNLRLVLSLGPQLREWISTTWGKPSVTLKHPTEIPRLRWSVERFRSNKLKFIVQVGTFLRNTMAIYQVRTPSWLTKARLVQEGAWVRNSDALCEKKLGGSPPVGTVEHIPVLNNDDYDDLLSCNLVFANLISSVANNVVIECIARNTPIIINRLSGVEHYIGSRYPLFYNDMGDVFELLTMENILAAHQYLCAMDKTWLRGEYFAKRVVSACRLLTA